VVQAAGLLEQPQRLRGRHAVASLETVGAELLARGRLEVVQDPLRRLPLAPVGVVKRLVEALPRAMHVQPPELLAKERHLHPLEVGRRVQGRARGVDRARAVLKDHLLSGPAVDAAHVAGARLLVSRATHGRTSLPWACSSQSVFQQSSYGR